MMLPVVGILARNHAACGSGSSSCLSLDFNLFPMDIQFLNGSMVPLEPMFAHSKNFQVDMVTPVDGITGNSLHFAWA